MSEELAKQEKLLESMAVQVETYKTAGKLEAAARLEEQRDLLQVNIQTLLQKLSDHQILMS